MAQVCGYESVRCTVMYLQRSLSRIFPPHIVDSMAFTEKTVSFP